jgi:hypothetical protein
LFACCHGQTSSDGSGTHDDINRLLENYYSTMSERNWEDYQTFFSDDATITTIWAVDSVSSPEIYSNTIDEFIAQTKAGPDSQPIFEEKMLSSEISVKGDLAQAWVNYQARFGSTDNLMEWKGTDLFSFIYFNSEWKIVSIVFAQE